MTNAQKLYKLLEEEVIADVEDHMDYLYDLIATKKATQEDKDDLKETQMILKEFKNTLTEINNGEMDEEECLELIEELEAMRQFDEDEEA
jgi:DNA-binding transcriptional regulator YhcF (GntR family)